MIQFQYESGSISEIVLFTSRNHNFLDFKSKAVPFIKFTMMKCVLKKSNHLVKMIINHTKLPWVAFAILPLLAIAQKLHLQIQVSVSHVHDKQPIQSTKSLQPQLMKNSSLGKRIARKLKSMTLSRSVTHLECLCFPLLVATLLRCMLRTRVVSVLVNS